MSEEDKSVSVYGECLVHVNSITGSLMSFDVKVLFLTIEKESSVRCVFDALKFLAEQVKFRVTFVEI